MRADFGVLILTNRRPGNVKTIQTLRRAGYTGKITLVLDNEDPSREEYRAKWSGEPGVSIVVFDKAALAGTFDIGDNFQGLSAVVYARRASAQVARDLGLRYFLALDDDYTSFEWKFNAEMVWTTKEMGARSIDRVFAAVLDFLITTPTKTITIAQGGDFMGGGGSTFGGKVTLYRKAMNSFFCDVEREIEWRGRLNEDVNTYVTGAVRGELFFTHNHLALVQVATQQAKGGVTELYRALGTYAKSFYTVMIHPSGVRVRMLQGEAHSRLHHSIDWSKTAPKILSETTRKPR